MKWFEKKPDFKNYKPLVGSFLLALLLWSAVTTDKVYTIRIHVPLHIIGVAPGYVLLEQPPKSLTLKVRGKGRALITLYFYKPKVTLEFPRIKKTTTIKLSDYASQIYIGQDLGVHLEDIIEPRTIELKVDRLLRASKPIKVPYRIRPLPGFVLSRVEPAIKMAEVSGPAKLVKATKFIVTDSLVRNDVRYPFSAKLTLHSPKPGIIHVTPRQVNVKFVIEQIVERTIYNIPIQLIGFPPDLEARAVPPVISVRVKGSEQKIMNLKREQITAVFDYQKDYRLGRNVYVPHFDKPEGVNIIKVSPKTFRLLLKKKEISE